MTTTSTMPPSAPWKSAFQSLLSKTESGGQFYLATYGPRVRTCQFRGFAGELKEKEHGEPKNPDAVSDLLTLTSDTRMDKYQEIKRNPGFEACFWFQETQDQYRIRGNAHICSLKDQISPDLQKRVIPKDSAKSWSWKQEWERQFSNLSPMMKGTFRSPTPGSPWSEEKQKDLGKKADQETPEARDHFCVIVLEPNHVERLNTDPPGLRTEWVKEKDAWTENRIMP